MQAWIENPNESKSKMLGVVRKYGVMPKQYFPEETIAKIADYMFNFEIDQSNWFEVHFNKERGKGYGN